MNEHENLLTKDKQNYLPTFNRFPLALDRAKGAKVWDMDGKEYIDMLAGIAVNNVGHCHPTVVKAIQQQAEKLMHISNFYVSVPQVALSEKLTRLSGLERIFFTNSGAESVEGAIKVARKYAHSVGRGGEIISMQNSFHGRTMATIATGKKQMQDGFEPIPAGFKQVKFNDIEALKAAISEETAAIILEPIQGEGGIWPAEPEYMKQVRRLCDDEGIVLIFDEIQCGMGRTGKMFAKEHYGIQPDVMTLAKGLGSGTPIGAFLCNGAVAGAMNFGDHGTTFGGNPLVCAAALATLEVIETEDLLKAATEKGAWLQNKLKEKGLKGLQEVRGLGLMVGASFDFETKPYVLAMLEKGLMANATAGNVLRFVPPLTIGYDEMEKAIDIIAETLNENHG